MNERIKELAEQAGVFEGVFTKHGGVPCDLKGYGMLEDEMAKFAELIVMECGVALSPMLRDMVSRGQAFDLIKQHFGVKE